MNSATSVERFVRNHSAMTFEGFVSTTKNWNPALFEQWKCIVRDKYCSSPDVGAIHGDTIPLFPRYMLHIALRLEESEGLEDYSQAVLALKRYLESHGKSVSEELRRSPLADMVHDELVLHGKSSMLTTDFGAVEQRVIATAQEQLNDNAARLFEKLAGQGVKQ